MSDQNDSFFREVEEQVRRDRMGKFFDKYGVFALVAGAAIILGIAGYQWYRAVKIDAAQTAGGRFAAAQRLLESNDEKDTTTAVSDFETLAREGGGAYDTLARLQLAGRQLDAGKTEEAKALFRDVAGNANADPKLRSYADLQLIALEADGLDWTTLKNRLTSYSGDDSTWRYTARELLASKALKLGQFDEAKQVLSQLLGDTNTPQSLRQRAEMLMSLASRPQVEATARPPEPKAPAPASNEGASERQGLQTITGGDTKKPEEAGKPQDKSKADEPKQPATGAGSDETPTAGTPAVEPKSQ